MKVSVSFLAPQQKQSRKGAALTPGMEKPAARAQPGRSPPGWKWPGSAGSSRTPLCYAEPCAPEGQERGKEELSESEKAGGRSWRPGFDTAFPTKAHKSLSELNRENLPCTQGQTNWYWWDPPAVSALGHYFKKGVASEELNHSKNPVTAGLKNTGIMDNISCNCSTANPPRLVLNSREYFQ